MYGEIKMNKAILVIDMPRVCSECDMFRNYYDDEHEDWFYACAFLEEKVDSDVAEEKKCDDCPLKELPQRKCDTRAIKRRVRDLSFESGFREDILGVEIDEYAKGFNACIDEILGEEE